MEANIGLFDNGNEANRTSTVTMVETVLVELGHYLNECRVDTTEATHAWRVIKGSASIRISLLDNQGYPNLRIVSPIMTTDARVDHLRLYGKLLQLNYKELRGAAFAVRQNEVLLVAERSTLDIDRTEVLEMIARVQEYADHYDNLLVDEFGGSLGGND